MTLGSTKNNKRKANYEGRKYRIEYYSRSKKNKTNVIKKKRKLMINK